MATGTSGADRSSPTTSTSLPGSAGSSADSSATSSSFAGRTVATHGDAHKLLGSSTDGSSASHSVDLRDRAVAGTTGGAALPADGTIPLANGGKIIFERVNPGCEPTVKDGLVSEVHKLEKSGKIDEGSTSKVEKFFSGASKVLDFFMHNKKFQVAVGFIGCAVCIAGGVACPVLLIGVGPCVLVFANGFIDNPMLTAPEGPAKSGAANPEGSKGVDGAKDKDEDKDKGKEAPKVKSKGSGGPQPPDSDDDDVPPAGAARTTPRRSTNDDDDPDLVEDVSRAVVRKMNASGDPVTAHQLTGGIPNQFGGAPSNGGIVPFPLSEAERVRLANFGESQTEQQYIDAQDLGGGVWNFENSTEEDIVTIKNSIRIRANQVAANYRWTTVETHAGKNLTPTLDELTMIKNALTREVIDELFDYVRDHGPIPDGRRGLRDASLLSEQLLQKAAKNIGLPVGAHSEGSLVHQILGGRMQDYKAALDEWCRGAGILSPKDP